MTEVLAIAAGGALGSVLRYWVSGSVHGLLGRAFPYGTLVVNVAGSLLIGFLFVWLVERAAAGGAARAGVLVGLLGGFTTFSAFSLETLNLIQEGAWPRAVLNAALSLVLCVAAAGLGVVAARQL